MSDDKPTYHDIDETYNDPEDSGDQVIAGERLRLNGLKVKKVTDKIKGIDSENEVTDRTVEITLEATDIQEEEVRRLQRCDLYGHTVNTTFWFSQPQLKNGDQASMTDRRTEEKPVGTVHVGDVEPSEDRDDAQGDEWAEAQTLDGFRVGETVIVKPTGDKGIIHGIEDGSFQVIDEHGIGGFGLFSADELAHNDQEQQEAVQTA